jgi:hypothetical protein
MRRELYLELLKMRGLGASSDRAFDLRQAFSGWPHFRCGAC